MVETFSRVFYKLNDFRYKLSVWRRVLQDLPAKKEIMPTFSAWMTLFLTQTHSYHHMYSNCKNCVLEKMRHIMYL